MLELLLVVALATEPVEVLEAAAPAEPTDDSPAVSIGPTYDYSFTNSNLTEVGGGRTRVSALAQMTTPSYGYFPLVVHIDNTLGPRQTLKLSFNSQGADGPHTFTRSVEVAQGERRSVTLPLPSHVRYGNLRARAPGITERGDAQLYFNGINGQQRAVLNIGTPVSFETAVGARPAYSGTASVQVSSLTVAEAPAELAPYVGWDTVVLTEGPFEALSEAQRRALENYAALGGHLVLMQGPRGLSASFPLLSEDRPQYGLGRVTFCQSCAVETALGHSAHVPVRAIEPKGRRYAYEDETVSELSLPVARAPVGRFILIIALFTLAIGPGSLWIARRKGSAALLVTIPGTALVTCLAIIGYSALRDGFTVHSTVQGFTLLDTQRHRAITASVAAFYANLAPGSATFPSGALVVAPTPRRDYGATEQTASISWDEGSRFGADFIPSRSYVEWSLLSVAPTRARLVVRRAADGKVLVQNALGAPIEYAQLRLGDGLYSVTALADGAEAAAQKQKHSDEPDFTTLNTRASEEAEELLSEPLRESEFLAALKGPGFTPLGELRLKDEESRHIVRGGLEQ